MDIGQAGEVAVRAMQGIGPKARIFINGRSRIPDGLIPDEVLSEGKNVSHLSWTQQLQDFADFARANGLRFDLYVRQGAELTTRVQQERDNGVVNIIYFGRPE